MTLKKIFLLIIVFECIFIGLIICILKMDIRQEQALMTAESVRLDMHEAADQLRQISDDLTRFARAYAATGDEKYKDAFFRVAEVRNGTASRPENGKTYWDDLARNRFPLQADSDILPLESLFKSRPFTEEEAAKLREAYRNSEDLADIEKEAFSAMDGKYKDSQGEYTQDGPADRQMAINLLHSEEYERAKQRIHKPINEFMDLLNKRTKVKIDCLKSSVKWYNRLLFFIVGAFFLFNCLAFLTLHRRVIKVLHYIIFKIKESKGTNTALNIDELPRSTQDEMGELIRELNTMQSILSKRTEMLQRSNTRLINQYNLINKYVIISESTPDGTMTYVSDAFCRISGYAREELVGSKYNVIYHEDIPQDILEDLRNRVAQGLGWQGEVKSKRKNGSAYWTEVHIEPVYDNNINLTGYRSIRTDITNRKHLEEMSITDTLTGVNNRYKLNEILHYVYENAERYGTPFSLIMIDIDRFKRVNDSYGHQAGDEVLKRIGKILRENIRKTDTAGRWGGEEFLIICPETDLDNAALLAGKLRALWEGQEFSGIRKQTASFGVTEYQINDTVHSVISRADAALYEAKERGRNQVRTRK